MKYGKIYTYKNKDKAEVGRRYIFSDDLYVVAEVENEVLVCPHTLKEVRAENVNHPFRDEENFYHQFIREVIEEPKLMTMRQLAEWLAKGNGQLKVKDNVTCSIYFSYPYMVDDNPTESNLLIRPWGSDEWVEPTYDIYERDCLNKEVKA